MVRLFGSDYSVYVRIARLCLAEKNVSYTLVPVDVFASEGVPRDYLQRHPFARIPAFEHGSFRLYETGAIARYVDEAFEGPDLQPHDPAARARCNQLISIADGYAYRHMVWGVYVERVSKPEDGAETDEAKLAASIAQSQIVLTALCDVMEEGPWMLGDQLTLADIYWAPMVDCFRQAPEGAKLMAAFPKLQSWWQRMAARPSVIGTRPT
ncbi:glutathione S-transferase family protein [Pseudohoeflea suaedae]|uniref:glutathione S-transferase family protein n=1 Tax=Pseudohoeflea suaedae TaxID=877384 RepID=UPI00268F8EFA